jgi:hypothetical protein
MATKKKKGKSEAIHGPGEFKARKPRVPPKIKKSPPSNRTKPNKGRSKFKGKPKPKKY